MGMNPDNNPRMVELKGQEQERRLEQERERLTTERSARPKAASSSLLACLRQLLGR
jgi:hypothetical protein